MAQVDNYNRKWDKMSNEMECMCLECGMSIHMPEDLITLDPSDSDSKLLDILLVCENCGGQLKLVGKAGDEPSYRLE
jgi:hypothetical protein